jgi:multidrug efflux pump subunit AcrB
LPPGYRLEIGGDSDARSSTLNNLLAPLGLIVTLSVAVVVMTFRSFRLAGVALVASGLSAGLSMLALAVFQYPFGITAIIGLIGSIGVSINAALIIMTALQEQGPADPNAAPDEMVGVVMDTSRHIVSTTVTTFGGFLPLILAGGGFWPPFAMAVAGGVLLSTVVSFYFTPAAYRLVRAKGHSHEAPPAGLPVTLLAAAE